MKYLLDTCVISELIARRPNRQVISWIDGIDDERFYLSVITIGEIQRGIKKLPESNRRDALEQWLAEELLIRFKGRLVAIDATVMLAWGELVARLEERGRKLPAFDSLIAAITVHHDFHLVTRNEKDFAGTELRIINPWTS